MPLYKRTHCVVFATNGRILASDVIDRYSRTSGTFGYLIPPTMSSSKAPRTLPFSDSYKEVLSDCSEAGVTLHKSP